MPDQRLVCLVNHEFSVLEVSLLEKEYYFCLGDQIETNKLNTNAVAGK